MKKEMLGIFVLFGLAVAIVNSVVVAGGVGTAFVSNISDGVTKGIYIGDVLAFNAFGERQTVMLAGLKGDSATVQITLPSRRVVMAVGEEKKFDLNNDSVMDLYLKIDKILVEGKSAEITIKTISESGTPVTPVVPAIPAEEQKEPSEANQGAETESVEKSNTSWMWWIVGLVAAIVVAYFIMRAKRE